MASGTSTFSSATRPFWWRKLHSLSGVVPVGAFFIVHFWTNAKALQGRQVYDDAVRELQEIPYLLVVETLVIYLPLAFHALYGLKISLEGKPNVGAYPFAKNWAYVLQRLTGVITLVFVAYHLWQFRIQVALGRMHPTDLFTELCASLSSTSRFGIPVVAVMYLVAVASAAYHFANGLHGFCFSWGLSTSRRASRFVSGVCGIVGIALFVVGANTVIYFATGSKLVLSPDRPDAKAATCREFVGERSGLARGELMTGQLPW
jgi:succinate dehydrogenase/fumarate reductase cytochrome b subunit (b558 family)